MNKQADVPSDVDVRSALAWLWGEVLTNDQRRALFSDLQEVAVICDETWNHWATAADRLRPRGTKVLTACDRCTKGVMDADNPHLHVACSCPCHGKWPWCDACDSGAGLPSDGCGECGRNA